MQRYGQYGRRAVAAACVAFAVAASSALADAEAVAADDLPVAVFAGGCFWCVESDFDSVPGVVETLSGYTGGDLDNPTYRQVSKGGTGHFEAVRIRFDPQQVSYERLLHIFWRSVDPTDAGGQFCDRGDSYRTAIFVADAEQRHLAEASKEELERAGTLEASVVTPILPLGAFHGAEDYHQDYYVKNPLRYRYYRFSCRRDARVRAIWGDQAHAGIKGR